MDGSIFLVHGSDDVRKVEVARMLEQATGREVVILHEQPNRGRTLIEKFEDHAGSAAFAVVILTADDEGRHKGTDSDLMLRGRQNVVFEMGFFFAALGRSRVVVLLDDGIEKPSDVDGIVYVGLDSEGVWKLLLAKELAAATIHVDLSKIV
ncbi:MAG: nucleotide-binding protein [Actinomycetota bacterium]|nr:nucleotide-binding protein [Actinomycetota bacterium]